MPSKVTYTGTVGPGITATAVVFNNVSRLNLDFSAKTGTIYYNNGDGPAIAGVTLNGVTTLTDTIASGNHTIVIS